MRLARVDSDTFSTAMASALATRVGPLGPISTPPAGIAACHTNFEVRTGALKTLCIPAPGQSTRQGTAAPSRQDAGPSRDAGVPNRSRPGPQDPIPHRDAVPGRCAPLARARRLTCVAPCDLRGGTEERGEVGLGVSARFPRGTKEVQLGWIQTRSAMLWRQPLRRSPLARRFVGTPVFRANLASSLRAIHSMSVDG